MSAALEIASGSERDLPILKSWLAAAGLPVEDLTAAHMRDFLIATAGGIAVGVIGLEQFDDVGLLRSLVVEPTSRRHGTGKALVAALEKRATAVGVTELWLLTIDADGYFARLGFEIMDRGAAPATIQSTDEFSRLCPGDAVLMRKYLLERLLSPSEGTLERD